MPPTTGQPGKRARKPTDETASEESFARPDASERERTALERQVAALESDVASLEEEVDRLEAALARKDQRLQGAIDRYERIIAERNRERRTDGRSAESTSSGGTRWARISAREIVGSLVARLT
jgi:septal ring factor EnvC (AmiA/AmiB activator)